jgi:hypothetical protein
LAGWELVGLPVGCQKSPKFGALLGPARSEGTGVAWAKAAVRSILVVMLDIAA